MSDFIYDWTSLPTGKSDAAPLTGLANQNLVAAEWNSTCQAILDLRNIAAGQGISVKSFGAGNGNAAQDLAAFQAAITVAGIATKHVHIPAGLYHFDMTSVIGMGDTACLIQVPTGFTFTGEGDATVLKMENLDGTPSGDSGRNLFGVVSGAEKVVFRDFKVIGQNGVGDSGFTFVEQNQSSAICYLLSATTTNCKVFNVTFENLYGFSIHAPGYSNRCQIFNCTTRWCANGINVNGHETNQSFNILYKSEGFECSGSSNIFVGNMLRDCYKSGFSIGGDQTVGVINHGCIVANNVVDGITNPGTPNTGLGILLDESTCNCVVSGNQVRRTSGYGICISSALLGAVMEGHLIANNQVINCSSGFPYVAGILVGAPKTRVTGNIVMNVSHSTLGYVSDETGFSMQIGLIISANDCIVDNNTLGGTNYGLAFTNGTTGNVHYCNRYPQSTYKVSFGGGSTYDINQTVVGDSANAVIQAAYNGTSIWPFTIDYLDGKREYGSGAAALDTNLYRGGANLLKTDDTFVAMGGFISGGEGVFNVKAYGAVGDGTTDDYDAIKLAILALKSAGGGTLLFPKGTYKINRYKIEGGGGANGVTDILVDQLSNFTISGYGAKIDVKGDFNKPDDYTVGGFHYSYSQSVIPLMLSRCSNFVVEGLEFDGNVDQTTRAPGVVEGSSYGIITERCSNWKMRDLNVHHFSCDNLMVGFPPLAQVDRNALIEACRFHSAARNNITVLHARDIRFVACVTENAGYTAVDGATIGAYGSHSPAAGVDIEPETPMDAITGNITFDKCTFRHCVGSLFGAAVPSLTEHVTIMDSSLDSEDSAYALPIIMSVKNGVIENCWIDVHAGSIFPTFPGTDVSTIIRNNRIYSSGQAITSDTAQELLIEGNELIGTMTVAGSHFLPYLQNSKCTFRKNKVFIPKEFWAGFVYQVASLLQNLRRAEQNEYSTDLTGVAGHFAVDYSTTVNVADEMFLSGSYFRSALQSERNQSLPYTRFNQRADALPDFWGDTSYGQQLLINKGTGSTDRYYMVVNGHSGIQWVEMEQVIRSAAIPTSGTWAVGDEVKATTPVPGGSRGWVCTTAGTAGTYSEGRTATTDGTTTVVISSASAVLSKGMWVQINATRAQITNISGTTVTVSVVIPAGGPGLAIAYSAPVFKEFGLISV